MNLKRTASLMLKYYPKLVMKRVLKKLFYMVETKNLSQGHLTIIGISSGIDNVEFEGENGINYNSEFFGNIRVGYATTLGFHNAFHGDITIGRYCQFGANVAVMSNNHPTHTLSTYINNRLFSGELMQLVKKGKVIIGHDVWVGHGAIILGNVHIGNGAIIAAGAVVTKDVPPYCIVGGVPAKIIKKRFNDNIIQQVEALEWWYKDKEELEKIKPLFFKDISKVNNLYEF